MVMKTDYEKKLLEASKTFDSAISQKDVSSLTNLLAKDAILHHGGLVHVVKPQTAQNNNARMLNHAIFCCYDPVFLCSLHRSLASYEYVEPHASADGITRVQDIVGSDNILGWLQSYPNQYDYKSHDVIAGAVDEQNKSAFSFFLDQVGARRPGATDCCEPAFTACVLCPAQPCNEPSPFSM